MKEPKKQTFKFSDYSIEPPSDEDPDGTGNADLAPFAFTCPRCGTMCGYIQDGGMMGCSECGVLWERVGDKLSEADEDDV